MRKFIAIVGLWNPYIDGTWGTTEKEYHIRAWTADRAYAKIRDYLIDRELYDEVRFINVRTVREDRKRTVFTESKDIMVKL